MELKTRFAPSPTGQLHLGHAYSAYTAWDIARSAGGACLLRIEDIDATRSRPEFEAGIYEDLRWLGFAWPEPVMRQSERLPAYSRALTQLRNDGLLYPCTCTRGDIAAALSAPQEGVPRASVYPGTCRGRVDVPENAAWRLDMSRAISVLGGHGPVEKLVWEETGLDAPGIHHLDPQELIELHGDVVLGRRDIGTSYSISVVTDDAEQGITHVVRGQDLAETTPLHRLLQELLGLPVPVWHHHRLIRDENGKRLAKRDDARALATLRENGAAPADILAMFHQDQSGSVTGFESSIS